MLGYAARGAIRGAERASRAIYEGTLETPRAVRGRSTSAVTPRTTEFTDAVIEKIRTKIEIWSSL